MKHITDWMPIESAPKDGSTIIVAGGTVCWRNSGWFSHSAQAELQWKPLHWMPLPNPPEKP